MATGTPVLVKDLQENRLRRISYSWTSTSGGAVVLDAIRVTGFLWAVDTAPGATAPTSYNLKVYKGSTSGVDILLGAGASRSATVAERCRPTASGIPTMEPLRDEDIVVSIDTAGNAKTGTFDLYFLQPQ